MLVVENRLPVAEGRADEFEALFEQRTPLATDQPGFIRLELLRPIEGDHYVIQAHWESRAAFEAWRSSDAFVAAHQDIPAKLFDGSNQLTMYHVVVEADPERSSQ